MCVFVFDLALDERSAPRVSKKKAKRPREGRLLLLLQAFLASKNTPKT
jgi:hypothetical protein